jgi:hypothetical protein
MPSPVPDQDTQIGPRIGSRPLVRSETRNGGRKLFPIRLVDYDAIREWECFDADHGKDLALEVREYFIPDFTNWKDQEAFEVSFRRLMRDLKAQNAPRDPKQGRSAP